MKCIGLKAGFTLVGSLAASLLLMGGAQAQVTVNVYPGFTDVGGGTPYSGFAGSFTAPNVQFATDTGFNWHPFGLGSFGADVAGCYDVLNTGIYTFGTYSDDGSLLFLEGSAIPNVDNGGPTPPRFITGTPISLTAGQHIPIEIQFFEDFGGPSGLDLYVKGPLDGNFRLVSPDELNHADCPPVPEPGTLSLLATGGLPLLGLLRRRRLTG